MRSRCLLSLLVLPLFFASACSTAYYAAMDRIGFEKRHIVVDRVKDARKSQLAAKKQFATALDEFLSATDYQGGELEKTYRKLESNYQRASNKAEAVKDRNRSVRRTGKALFKEWKKEIKEFSDPTLARASQQQYRASQDRFQQLLAAMTRAESSLDPVLTKFRDQTLFLKHNLNAKAINAVQTQVQRTKSDVATLIGEMERSIAEADRFIAEMQ